MAKVVVFNMVTLDGYICDPKGDMGWAHVHDDEWLKFVEGNAKGHAVLVFGRVTYQMMASYWPTPLAAKNDPLVAERMNSYQKIVFSRTLREASWVNTRLVKDGVPAEVRKLKKESDKDLVIFGSASIVSQLTQEKLIDEYQVVVFPLILGSGKSMFDGVKDRLRLRLTGTRAFKNGNVVLYYERAGA